MSFLAKLKELIGADAFAKVTAELGTKDLIVNDGNYIPKSKFDELNEKKKTLESEKEKLTKDLTEQKVKMESFEKDKGNESKTLEKLQAEIEKLQSERANDLKMLSNTKKEAAINSALSEAGVKNPKSLKLLIKEFDLEKIEFDEAGSLKGIEDKIKSLKEDFKPLFGETKLTGNPPEGGGGTPEPIAEISTEQFYAEMFGGK